MEEEQNAGVEVGAEAEEPVQAAPEPAAPDGAAAPEDRGRAASTVALQSRTSSKARYGAIAALMLALVAVAGAGAFRSLRHPQQPLGELQPPTGQADTPPTEEPPAPIEEVPAPAPPAEEQAPAPPEVPEEPWVLPTLSEIESKLPVALKRAKQQLAVKIKSYPLTHRELPLYASEAQELALLLSEGRTKQLGGLRMVVENVTPVGGGTAAEGGFKPRQLIIKGVIGRGCSNLILTAVDDFTGERFAVRIFMKESDSPAEELEDFKEETEQAMKQECRIAGILADGKSPREATDRGFALPLVTGSVSGLQEVSVCPKLLIHNRVQLWEHFWGDLADVEVVPPYLNADMKAYLCQSMLLSLLHMQERNVAHLDIKKMNIFLDSEARPLLGDQGSSCVFGDVLPASLTLTPISTELELLQEFLHGDVNNPQKAEPFSDIWSFGFTLYEVFVADSPYGLGNLDNEQPATVLERLEELRKANARPSLLLEPMKERRVPERWQQLIMRMLDINRETRITAEQIKKEFRDLVDGRGGMPAEKPEDEQGASS